MKQRLWGGAFAQDPNDLAWSFGQSIDSDLVLWREEIEVSMAHAEMLGQVGIISADEARTIRDGLEAVAETLHAAEQREDPLSNFEDIHAAVESMLREKIGEVADKLHSGRSRNDQIATATRLWVKRQCEQVEKRAKNLQQELLRLGEKHASDPMPGFTHMQSAQPITLGFHLMAYFWMLQRDISRMRQVIQSVDSCPLGSAAIAGTSLPVDRQITAGKLGFSSPAPNALDATSDRDFVGDALHALAMLMQHLSRLSHELVLWSGQIYGFAKLDESLTTGSSIMPQKRNPDMAELIRGRTARVIGHWTAFMAMMKGLPLGYNRDQQEDKPPLFDAFALCHDSLVLCTAMLATAAFDLGRMAAVAGDGFSTATGVAEALVMSGIPFRKAHELTGKLVRTCEQRGMSLSDLAVEDLDGLSPSILECVSVSQSIASRNGLGGTGPDAVATQIAEAKSALID